MWLLALGAAIVGLAAIPLATAQADTCTITVTLVTGQKETFTVNVPAGTPISSIPLPITGTVASMSESCQSTGTGTISTPIKTPTTGIGTTTKGKPVTDQAQV